MEEAAEEPPVGEVGDPKTFARSLSRVVLVLSCYSVVVAAAVAVVAAAAVVVAVAAAGTVELSRENGHDVAGASECYHLRTRGRLGSMPMH